MGNSGSSMPKEITHSINTINKAYEGSPNMARDVIASTLPSMTKNDYNKMHEILEKVKKENCETTICETTIENIRKSMTILREAHEKNPVQVVATEQFLKKSYSQSR